MANPLSEDILSSIFKTSAKHPDRLIKREDTNHEFKESYNHANMAMYFKTIAAFANNEGGYLIFGVKDTPHKLLGLKDKALEQFENLNVEIFTKNLNEYFSQTIRWVSTLFEFRDLTFGIIYVYPLVVKPAICKKSYDCTEKKYSLKDADIYFRYAGRSERIKSADLERIIDERRRNEEKLWLSFIEKASKIGIQNASLIDMSNGVISEKGGTIFIDKKLLNQMKFIKEGEFNEKQGAPTLRLIGDVQQIETGKLLISPPKRIVKAIEQTDIIESFLKQETVDEPLNYISHICSCFSGYLPVYYYISLSNSAINEAILLVESNLSRYQGKQTLLKRLNGKFCSQRVMKKVETELSKQKEHYITLWEEENINPSDSEVKACVAAITYLNVDIIEAHTTYILSKLHGLYMKYYANAKSDLAQEFRNAIVYLDETLYRLKINQ